MVLRPGKGTSEIPVPVGSQPGIPAGIPVTAGIPALQKKLAKAKLAKAKLAKAKLAKAKLAKSKACKTKASHYNKAYNITVWGSRSGVIFIFLNKIPYVII